MQILILGGNGMLGHRLCQMLSRRFDVWATFRGDANRYENFDFLNENRRLGGVDAENLESIRSTFDIAQPAVVINALGIVKQRDDAKVAIPSIQINALFPHQLAAMCESRKSRLIHISTDCVFSGLRGNYTEIDNPDPVDLYGRTKLLGELHHGNCLTLRTSIIGWQTNTFSSLLSWFALQRGRRIKGYQKAIYSGFSTTVLSNLIGDIIETRPDLHGLYHVSSAPISKYELLVRLRDSLKWDDIHIDPDENFFCDRSLNGTRFTTTTGWIPPSWDAMAADLASEWPHYAKWYAQ
ncbi:MAG TPA: SDR family oxidoreductase [Anaerolineales bacterium]|nr:SDR family oxidoreductase [Anaerolineales bacterium]